MSDEQQPKRPAPIQKVIDAVGKDAAEEAFKMIQNHTLERVFRCLGRQKVLSAFAYNERVDTDIRNFEKGEKPDIHIVSPEDLPPGA